MLDDHLLTDSDVCDNHWTEFKGNCYLKGSNKLTWHQAELDCMSHGGHLSTASPSTLEVAKNLVSIKQFNTIIYADRFASIYINFTKFIIICLN